VSISGVCMCAYALVPTVCNTSSVCGGQIEWAVFVRVLAEAWCGQFAPPKLATIPHTSRGHHSATAGHSWSAPHGPICRISYEYCTLLPV